MTVRDERQTHETKIRVAWNPGGAEAPDISTGLPFFDHMLQSMALHGDLSLDIRGEGDLEVDPHHLVEDVGIVLGRVLAGGRPENPVRFGWAVVPMDEALVMVSLDFGGRAHLAYDMELPPRNFGGFHTDNAEDFFRSLVSNAGMTLHLRCMAGHNAHHILEGAFKALGLALRMATAQRSGGEASTKGLLERPI